MATMRYDCIPGIVYGVHITAFYMFIAVTMMMKNPLQCGDVSETGISFVKF